MNFALIEAASQLLTSLSASTGIPESRILLGFVLFIAVAIISAIIKSVLRIGIVLFLVYVGYSVFTVN